MPHLKLTIAYDGTGLVGWQRQPAGTSVQGLLEDALLPLEPDGAAVTGAGRTDAGVHALAQVASVTLRREIDPAAVVRAINMRLPPEVRVIDAEEMPQAFHARFDAVAKTYRYRIWNGEVLSPFERRFVWHVPSPRLDVDAMAAAAARLEGTHDYAAFQGTDSDAATTTRTIFTAGVRAESSLHGDLISLELRGDGFLRHMVRALAGTLVEVGRGRQSPGWIDEVLASGSRARAGRTAPPAGLFLVDVEYSVK